MRYYDITVTDPTSGAVVKRWASHTNGVFNPGAQNIEFDILSGPYDDPMGPQALQIEGVSLQDLGSAQDFTGLQKGLPLANPAQAGGITKGTIWQSFGNWQGTEMALNFVITPSAYSYDNPGNIVLNWKAGTQLSNSLANTLSIAYPNYPVTINISPKFVASADQIGNWPSLEGLAQAIAGMTAGQLSAGDPGVVITLQSGKLVVYDSTYAPGVIQLSFTDLVGQPTWIAANTIIFKLVLRGDISLGSLVQLPPKMQNAPGMALTSAESFPSNLKYKTSFNGVFRVISNRHVGNYRSSDGAAWTTILTCVPING